MKRSSKLSLALHALGHMALQPQLPMTSEQLAAQNATNPVVVRRVLGLLKRAGLVLSDKGHAGGWRLAKIASDTTVGQVYLAIGERFFAPHPTSKENAVHCAIEQALQTEVGKAMTAAEALLVDRLNTVTIAGLADAMQAKHPT